MVEHKNMNQRLRCVQYAICSMLTWHSTPFRYKHVPGVIHIRRDDLLLKHRPWHTMLRSTVSDHGMMKYSKGIYRHMPGGLESLPSFFAPKPVKKMYENVCSVTGWGKTSSQPSTDGEIMHNLLVCL